MRVVPAVPYLLVFALASTQAADAAPGDLISATPIAAPVYAKAWRVVYESTDPSGAPRFVSGMIIVPSSAPPANGRAVVSWAHPTTGIAESCGPSESKNRYALIPGLASMLARGYVVAATDYPGLGTPGIHPYLIGVSEARSVIDIVRTTRTFRPADASNRYVAWGHSQGGQAVLFVNQIARSYAPDLDLEGVVAVAPPTQLEQNLHDVITTEAGRVLASYTLVAWSQIFNTAMKDVTRRNARPIVRLVAKQCSLTRLSASGVMLTAKLLSADMLLPSFWTSKAWVDAAEQNSPNPLRLTAPLLMVQGTADRTVLPSLTAAFVEAACSAGARLDFLHIDGGSHFWAGMDSAGYAGKWIAKRFASQPARGCATSDIQAPPHRGP